MTGLEIGFLCLALNVYYEARSEPEEAQIAVAHVTINRARKKGRPICEEVYSPHQFSWTRQIVRPPEPTDPHWIQAQHVARLAFSRKDFTGGALWYHRHDITPYWRWAMKEVGRWGDHVFYKCKRKFRHACKWK